MTSCDAGAYFLISEVILSYAYPILKDGVIAKFINPENESSNLYDPPTSNFSKNNAFTLKSKDVGALNADFNKNDGFSLVFSDRKSVV